MGAQTIAGRVASIDWQRVETDLDTQGYALAGGLLAATECTRLIALDRSDDRFRSRIDMDQLGFGSGGYGYFNEPLPRVVSSLRTNLYRHLAPLANRLSERLGEDTRYPKTLAEYRKRCHAAGQCRPTPLLLRYPPGGYNRLHRDLYGALRFPFQVAVGLSRPRVDFEGGQFLLVENRPRQQAIGTAIELDRGTAIIFPVNERPVEGRRGTYRAKLRHGVSRITRGSRYTLGLIFHDAE